MQSTLSIMTAEGWQPVNRFAVTTAERLTADEMEAAAKVRLGAAYAMPSDTDDNRRNRHLALNAAYSATFKADDYRKGVRRHARQ